MSKLKLFVVVGIFILVSAVSVSLKEIFPRQEERSRLNAELSAESETIFKARAIAESCSNKCSECGRIAAWLEPSSFRVGLLVTHDDKRKADEQFRSNREMIYEANRIALLKCPEACSLECGRIRAHFKPYMQPEHPQVPIPWMPTRFCTGAYCMLRTQ